MSLLVFEGLLNLGRSDRGGGGCRQKEKNMTVSVNHERALGMIALIDSLPLLFVTRQGHFRSGLISAVEVHFRRAMREKEREPQLFKAVTLCWSL